MNKELSNGQGSLFPLAPNLVKKKEEDSGATRNGSLSTLQGNLAFYLENPILSTG